jgi:hypothetical protein
MVGKGIRSKIVWAMRFATRRQFLRASAATCLPLPFLSSLHGCAEAGAPSGHPLIVVRPGSGVAQEDGDEPERFWPSELGALTAANLRDRDADRVISELADYADRLLLVRGTRFAFKSTHEAHAGGGNQLLTAAQVGPPTDTVMTYAQGESIDSWVARQSAVNNGQPLTLYAGRRDDYGEEVLSYRGPLQLRGAESDPWSVYRRLIGADGGGEMRGSVNELILARLTSLSSSARLSAEDRTRLERHTDSVREFETMTARLSADVELAMQDMAGKSTLDAFSLDVAKLHCDLIALVLSTGRATAVTLQIGDRLDNANYTVSGQVLPSFHTLSHRLIDDADLGVFATTQDMHVGVNRLHMGVFRHLLDRLDEVGLLDTSVAVLVSDVATGSHRYDQLPWVIAGGGDGTLRQGQYVDAGNVYHNKLLATLLTATGHRTEEGDSITAFGDESLEPGLIDEMLA